MEGHYNLIYFGMLVVVMCSMTCWTHITGMHCLQQNKGSYIVIKSILIAVPFLCMLLIAGVRYDVGTDYMTYKDIFSWIRMDNAPYIEPGYRFLNVFIRYFTTNFVWIFLASSFITLLFFYRGIITLSSNQCMSIYLFITMGYYFYSFNAVRQYMALAVSFYASKYLKNGEFLKYTCFIIFAALFHKSVLIMIPLYFLLRLRFKVSYYFIISLFAAGTLLLHKQILNLIFQFIYSAYNNSDFLDFHFSYLNIAISIIVFIGTMIYYKPLLSRDRGNIIYINASFFSLILFLFMGWLGLFVSRLGVYLSVYFIITIPEIIACESKSSAKKLYTVIIYGCLFILWVMIMKKNLNSASRLLPYQTIFTIQ